ncbi:transposase [Caldichromatium japonicum]|uniref:transposase n=1 Tax=Caldichromatium japonicum TaxID=2699430 RepID=UPI001FE697B0|nr:transposase [Caldichromatium japonicum]
MARLPRFILPGYPQHVIQRGNNRQQILFDEEDYWFIWERLVAGAERFQCAVHAYVLMPNHFHLLLTPQSEAGIGKLMQYVGRYYVHYFNTKYGRSGTLWEGRYRATLVDPQGYLLAVAHYIESNPVRAGLVAHAGEYDWSSYGINAKGADDPLVTAHREYERLGRSLKARRELYTSQSEQPLAPELICAIRERTNKSWVLGSSSFCQQIERLLNRRALPRPRGGDRRSAAYRRGLGAQSSSVRDGREQISNRAGMEGLR